MVYLGIDVGTAGSKATAVDMDGNILSHAYGEYKAERTGEGCAEIDPGAVWRTVRQVIAQAAADAGAPVRAIAVASLGESFVALDRSDRVLRKSMLYSDVRGAEEIGDILAKIGEQELYDVTGMPVNAMYTLNKLLWVKKHEAGLFDSIDKLFLFEDYIYYMLSGERCIDYSLASRTMFFDVMHHGWAGRILSAFGLDASALSRPVAPGSVIGKVRGAVADELGLPKDTLLVAGGHDQVCAALGAGVVAKGECVDGIGTSECITAVLDRLDRKPYMRRNNFCIEPYAVDGEYVTLAFSTTGASILGWFCETVSGPAGTKAGPSVFGVLESECPAGPTDLLVLPHFAGSGTPYMDPYARGAVLGLRLGTSRGELYKACMEGICFEMMLNAQLLGSVGTRITGMTCVGGGARSETLLQVKADIMGLPVKRLKTQESGTMALAMLCAVACREYNGLGEAAARMVKIDRSFYPDRRNHEIYLNQFNTYRKLYPSIASLNN